VQIISFASEAGVTGAFLQDRVSVNKTDKAVDIPLLHLDNAADTGMRDDFPDSPITCAAE
jgi:hypothetical protein